MLKKRVVVAVAGVLCCLGACATNAAAADFAARRHSLTVGGTFETPAAYNASFGFDDWKEPARYLDLAVAAPGPLERRLHAAGLKTMLYVDPNFCSGSREPGRNPYPRPDCGEWPADAFFAQSAHPERNLSAREGSVLQRAGNPDSAEWRRRTLAALADALGSGGFDLIEFDDAVTPDEYYAALCWGTPSFEPGAKGCDGAPGGRARAPWDAGFTRAGWQRGESELVAAAPRPVVLNGLAGNDPKGLPVAAGLSVASANAWGGMCDACFFGNGAVPKNVFLWTGPLLDTRLQSALDVTAAGKNVVVVNEDVTDPAARARALADVMLFYDPDRTWTWGAPCGKRSHIPACPESALAFYEPLRPYPERVEGLLQPGGAYAREFGSCYQDGRPVGPCAAVVNPDPGVVHRLPRFVNAYGHTLEIAGDSLCVCYGDHGSLSLTGAPPPDPLPPAGGYVLFR